MRISTSEAEASESGPLPLRWVYALQRDEEGGALKAPVIESLSMRDALMALIEYAFRLELSSHGMLLRQLDLLERVARTVPVRLLRLPHDLAALPAARSLVLDDLAHA